jgi:hypothetical protein
VLKLVVLAVALLFLSSLPSAIGGVRANVAEVRAAGVWCVDSGCTNHMTGATRSGMVDLPGVSETGEQVHVIQEGVIYVPGLKQILLSTRHLTRNGSEVHLTKEPSCTVATLLP